MRVLGITGSIGMGKSTVCDMLRRMDVPVHDADATVHGLMAPGGQAVSRIAAVFPDTVTAEGAIDRRRLGQQVVADVDALRVLESILHPLVRAEEEVFLRQHRVWQSSVVALDIPLLYETGGERRCDVVAVISAPGFLQRQRVLSRPGMTEAKFQGLLRHQMPDAEKRRRADVVVPSGLGRARTWRCLARLLAEMRTGPSEDKGSESCVRSF